MFFKAWPALIFFGAATAFFGAATDVFFAAEPVDLPAPALLPDPDIVEAAPPLAALTDVVDDRVTAFFPGDALATLPRLAVVFFATDLPGTALLTTAFRATDVLLTADVVVLLAVVLPAALEAVLPAALLATLPTTFLPATFLLAAFLVAMLDSRSIWPLMPRRPSR